MQMTRSVDYRFLFILFVASLLGSCRQRITRVVIDDAAVTVGPTDVDVQLQQPVVAEWDYQVLRLTVLTKFSDALDPLGLKLDDQSVVVPGVDLVTDQGVKYTFKLSGFRNSDIVDFDNGRIERNTRFVRLQMRCAEPIVVSKVNWISYMPQDTKTGNP
jgi:hypothetical protein